MVSILELSDCKASSSGRNCHETGHIAKFCSKKGAAKKAPARNAPNTAFKSTSGERESCPMAVNGWGGYGLVIDHRNAIDHGEGVLNFAKC